MLLCLLRCNFPGLTERRRESVALLIFHQTEVVVVSSDQLFEGPFNVTKPFDAKWDIENLFPVH